MSSSPVPASVPAGFRSSRRALLRAGVGVSALAASGAMVACSSRSEDSPEPATDPLLVPLAAARSDAAAATAAIAVTPDRAGDLAVVSSERSAHADALAAEIGRIAGTAGTSSAAAPPPPVAPAGAPPSLAAVRDALSSSARAAADLARTQSGFRAGLLGSISASCSVSATGTLA